MMSENAKRVLWRCSFMASKSLKCPARITMFKEDPPRYVVNKGEHVHAEMKRGKYYVKPDLYTEYSLVEESVIGSDTEYILTNTD